MCVCVLDTVRERVRGLVREEVLVAGTESKRVKERYVVIVSERESIRGSDRMKEREGVDRER